MKTSRGILGCVISLLFLSVYTVTSSATTRDLRKTIKAPSFPSDGPVFTGSSRLATMPQLAKQQLDYDVEMTTEAQLQPKPKARASRPKYGAAISRKRRPKVPLTLWLVTDRKPGLGDSSWTTPKEEISASTFRALKK